LFSLPGVPGLLFGTAAIPYYDNLRARFQAGWLKFDNVTCFLQNAKVVKK
jgi:hypothetical protein